MQIEPSILPADLGSNTSGIIRHGFQQREFADAIFVEGYA